MLPQLVPWSSWLGRLPVTQEITSSSLVGTVSLNGSVAQLVEQWIEAPCVGGSIPSRAMLLKIHVYDAGVV